MEDPVRAEVRLALRQLLDALTILETASLPLLMVRGALLREALRQVARLVPSAAFADTEADRQAVQRLLEDGPQLFPAAQVRHVLALARGTHQRTLALLEAPLIDRQRRIQTRRRVRMAALAAVGAAVLMLGALVARLTAPADLAAGKPFTQSSKWADCHPERHECGGYPMQAILHTLPEQSPWYLVDLGVPTTFSRATIVNRQDMAMARAVPLVLEASDDAISFREVARKSELFATWAPTFTPQTARFVRVRVDRYSTLHLESVRLHP